MKGKEEEEEEQEEEEEEEEEQEEEEEEEEARGTPATGDSLRPYEQQVLNHLASRAFNDVSSAE